MRSTKRVGLAVLFLIAAAMLVSTPAHAGSTWTPLTSTGAEPAASGEYCDVRSHWGGPYAWGDVSVRCAGLEPGATYYVTLWLVDGQSSTSPGLILWTVGSFTANTKGGANTQGVGKVTIKDVNLFPLTLHYIDVSNAGGEVVLTNRY